MNQQQVLEKLVELQDLDYQKFNAGLVPGNNRMIGVRMPDLRRLAKLILKDGSGISAAEAFLDACPHDFYEQSMLYGIVLGEAGFDIDKTLARLDEFLPHIDNWAVCDCTVNRLRIVEKNKEAVLAWIRPRLLSPEPFTRRVCICLLMNFYIEEGHIDEVLRLLRSVRSEEYYVNMGLAWALCECLIHFYEKTLTLLQEKSLSPWVQNKTIQKARESFRISAAQKQELLNLKIR